MPRGRTTRDSPQTSEVPNSEQPEKRRGRKPKTLPDYDGPRFEVAAGACKQIPLDLLNLHDGKFQIRATTRPQSLVESIRSHGVLDALVARPHPEKKKEYQLVSGFNRAEAARLAGLTAVPVIVKDLSDTDAFIYAYAENENRQSLNDLDRACAIRKLREAGAAKTTLEVAKLFRIGERQIQRLEGLLEYPQELQEAMAKGGITATHALLLNQGCQKYKTAFELTAWIAKTADERLSVADLRDAIKKAFRARSPKRQILRRKGNLLILDRKYITEASGETRLAAVAELEKIIAELRS
jgi:ParB/RepB/Spo0J family partition protein